MCSPQLRTWLAVTGSLLAHVSLAQRTPVAPLSPAEVRVQPTDPARTLGQPVATKASGAANNQLVSAAVANQTRPVIPPPLYLIDAKIIVSTLAKIAPNTIASIVVYKGDKIPFAWRSATAGGVIAVMLKPGVKVRSVSLAKLKRRQHVTGPVRFELDGRPLADTSLRIATGDIKQVAVRLPAGKGTSNVLNIKLLAPKPVPSKHQPGTIMLRGVAGR